MNTQQQLQRIAEPGSLGTIIRSEMDGQLAIARQYPRDLQLFTERSRAIATLDEATAAECIYALPRDNKLIEGPSVRLAEILAANYGNCRMAARIIEEAEEFVTAQGIFIDLETNSTTSFETRRRIVDKRGRRYNVDMIMMTANACCAIALRQAVLKGIPKPLWDPIYEEAKRRAVGDGKGLPEQRQRAIKAFEHYGVDEARILKALELRSIEEMGSDSISKLRGLFQAIKEGEISAAEAFPVAGASEPPTKTLDQFASSSKTATQAQPDVESAADAFEIGRAARSRNAGRTQWPGAWSDRAMIEAWVAGWDAADEELKGEEAT